MYLDFCTRHHYRGGKFQKYEQTLETKLNNYIDFVRMGAEGLFHKITKFTTKKSGKVDSELINNLVSSIISKKQFEDKEEKQFYYSFLYCASVLYSLEFEGYIENYQGVYDHIKISGGKDFSDLIAAAHLIADDVPGKKHKRYYLDIDEDFANGCSLLYELLTGEEFYLDSDFERPTEAEQREFEEDNGIDCDEILPEEIISEENLNSEEEQRELLDETAGEINLEPSAEERERAELIHQKNAAMIKVIYPKYMEFVDNLDKFKSLFLEYASESFFDTVKNMVSSFLVEEGYSIYNNEEATNNTMIMLTKVKRTLYASLYGNKR